MKIHVIICFWCVWKMRVADPKVSHEVCWSCSKVAVLQTLPQTNVTTLVGLVSTILSQDFCCWDGAPMSSTYIRTFWFQVSWNTTSGRIFTSKGANFAASFSVANFASSTVPEGFQDSWGPTSKCIRYPCSTHCSTPHSFWTLKKTPGFFP